MGFITLSSDNPNLSFIIKKNPASSPHTRPVRKGLCIGWFKDLDTKYVIKFTDTQELVSFPKNHSDEYDYLPYMQYCAPILMTCILKEMFGTCINQGSVDDLIGKCSISQGVMKLSRRAQNLSDKLNLYIKQYQIELKETIIPNIFEFSIKSEHSTVSELLQYAYILGYIFNCLTFGYNEKPDSSALDKIIKIINNINVPYYIRYLIKNSMIGRKEFDRVKESLQLSKDSNILMKYGNTQEQRCDFIAEHINNFCKDTLAKNKHIHLVDIGCGEGYYVKNILEMIEKKKYKVQYHAHDINESEMDQIDMLIKTDDVYKCVSAYRSIDHMIQKLNELSENDYILVIFSEVIEHIPIDDVKSFMIKLLKNIKFKQMIITTPTYEFNKHYMMTTEFRHPDHKQEFTKEQFIFLINDIIRDSEIDLRSEYYPVGDQINEIGMSQCIQLFK